MAEKTLNRIMIGKASIAEAYNIKPNDLKYIKYSSCRYKMIGIEVNKQKRELIYDSQ